MNIQIPFNDGTDNNVLIPIEIDIHTVETIQYVKSDDKDIKEIIDAIVQAVKTKKKEEDWGDNFRVCDECDSITQEGFVVDDGQYIFCSKECLHKHYTPSEWLEMYDEGNGDSYWTYWWDS